MPALTETGVEGFLAGLRRCGCEPVVENGVVQFTVTAVAGSHASQDVPTGVDVGELAAWPTAPPHWIHLPSSIAFPAGTNAEPSAVPGWSKHSRNIVGWGNAEEPAQAWLAHARAVLEES